MIKLYCRNYICFCYVVIYCSFHLRKTPLNIIPSSSSCHVALQMVTLPGSSGSPRPGLSPLTWGWGDRGRGWRRMAPEGGGDGDGDRGEREAAREERSAGWWLSLRGVPSRAPSPEVVAAEAAAAATTATAAAAAGVGDSTFKMAPAGWPVTSLQGRSAFGAGHAVLAAPPSCRALAPPYPLRPLRRVLPGAGAVVSLH